MSAYSREEMEEMMRRWLAVNDKAEREGNWRQQVGNCTVTTCPRHGIDRWSARTSRARRRLQRTQHTHVASRHGGVVLGGVVAGVGQLPAALAIASYSRKQEEEAGPSENDLLIEIRDALDRRIAVEDLRAERPECQHLGVELGLQPPEVARELLILHLLELAFADQLRLEFLELVDESLLRMTSEILTSYATVSAVIADLNGDGIWSPEEPYLGYGPAGGFGSDQPAGVPSATRRPRAAMATRQPALDKA